MDPKKNGIKLANMRPAQTVITPTFRRPYLSAKIATGY